MAANLSPPPSSDGTMGFRWMQWFFEVYKATRLLFIKLLPNGSDYGWVDYLASLTNARATGANVPTWSTFRGGIQAWEFSATQLKELWVSFHINHDFKVGTAIYPHVHWSTTSAGVGTVRWGIEYTIAKGHQQSAFPTTSTVFVEQASSGQYFHHIAEVSDIDAISSTELEVDAVVLMRIYRDAAHPNDTFTGTVHGLFADLHVQADRLSTLNKAPDFYN